MADEGSYYVTNNAQTAIVPTYGTALVATSPFILVQNQNSNSQRFNLDYVNLTAIVAGACTTTAGYTAITAVIDPILRYTSGGTNLTPNITTVNSATPGSASAGLSIYCGAIVATAASGAAKTIIGQRNIRPNVSTTVINVVGDNHMLNFGGVEAGNSGTVTIANANFIATPLPPIILAPSSSLLLYLYYPVMSAPSAATYLPEIGF